MRIPLNLPFIRPFTDEKLYELSTANKELRIERNANGQLFINLPIETKASFLHFEIGFELGIWNRKHQLGKISESNGGYLLPDGAMRAPDIAWVSHGRLATIAMDETKGFLRICPDFVIELMSTHDVLAEAQKKMQNWMENGVQLAWLIYPQHKLTYVYQTHEIQQEVRFDQRLLGGKTLPGFELSLDKLFG